MRNEDKDPIVTGTFDLKKLRQELTGDPEDVKAESGCPKRKQQDVLQQLDRMFWKQFKQTNETTEGGCSHDED
jgi:hypothetical protein